MTAAPDFAALLASATTDIGTISTAYSAFHDYSLGNQLLALGQCHARGITPGPLNTFPGWKALGRFVRRGEKALSLCQPVTCKRRTADEAPADDAPETFTRFIYRPRWFVLAQTDGADYTPPPLPAWDKARALAALDVSEIPFDTLDGNTQGYARDRSIAVSPVAALPLKTTFHELAHVLIGHTAEAAQQDDDRTPRTLREVEAEATALLCCAALNLSGVSECRGYIQVWNRTGQPIPEASARKVLKAADAILKAGRPTTTEAGR